MQLMTFTVTSDFSNMTHMQCISNSAPQSRFQSKGTQQLGTESCRPFSRPLCFVALKVRVIAFACNWPYKLYTTQIALLLIWCGMIPWCISPFVCSIDLSPIPLFTLLCVVQICSCAYFSKTIPKVPPFFPLQKEKDHMWICLIWAQLLFVCLTYYAQICTNIQTCSFVKVVLSVCA